MRGNLMVVGQEGIEPTQPKPQVYSLLISPMIAGPQILQEAPSARWGQFALRDHAQAEDAF